MSKQQTLLEYIHKSKGKNDECYTKAYAVEPLLEFLPPFKKSIIWCPFDTEESNFVKVLKNHGYNVIHSHIDDDQDFFEYEPEHFDLIISNPPFTGKTQIFERILSFNKPFAILMSITWLNDSAPMKLFYYKELQLLMFNKRMRFDNQPQDKQINFSCAYYCHKFLPQQIAIRELKI